MRWLRAASSVLWRSDQEHNTEQGRARERFRRIGLTTVAALGARGIAFFTGFVTVPLTLHYLGTERYGMWATLSSLIAMASFADLGLGNGLLNALSSAHGRNDRGEAQAQVSSAFFILVLIACALGAGFAISYPLVDWARLYNVTSPIAAREAASATAALVGCFLIGLPVGLVARIRQGYQEGYWNSVYDAVGNTLGLLGVVLAITFRASLVWLVVAMAGAQVAATWTHMLVLLWRDRTWLRVGMRHVRSATARRLLRNGLLFFGLQVGSALTFAPDNVIIAQALGADAVAQYAIVVKLFSVILLVAEVTLTPLWPAYGEAIERGDSAWVQQTLRRSIILAGVGSIAAGCALWSASAVLLKTWVGAGVTASPGLVSGLVAWTALSVLGIAAAMYLNAANMMWIQVICAAVMIPASILLKIALVQKWGVAGVPWAMAVAYTVFVAVPLSIITYRFITRSALRVPPPHETRFVDQTGEGAN